MHAFSRKSRRDPRRGGPPAELPAPIQRALAVLRRSTIDATDFAVPWALFHEQIATEPAFVAAGVSVKDPKIEAVIHRIARRFQPPAAIGRVYALRVGDLTHGFVAAPPVPAVFFHFGEEDLGIAGLFDDECRSHLVRFSLVTLETGKRRLD